MSLSPTVEYRSSCTRVLYPLCALLVIPGCLREGRERALADLDVGIAEHAGATFQSVNGLGHIRALTDGQLNVWASAPVVELRVDAQPGARRDWTITVDNCMPGAELASDEPTVSIAAQAGPRPTLCSFAVQLPDAAGQALTATLTLAPPDAATSAPYRFAAMSDIQDGLDGVHEVFQAINADPSIRFVISAGDITSEATRPEYDVWLAQLPTLNVPYFSTIGNHELFGDIGLWREFFGRVNVHFQFQGVSFSLVDSASASIDPMVYEWLDTWMAGAADVHVFATHYPPTDPVGIRNGSFISRNEANKLLGKLTRGGVDLTIYGHIHTHHAFDNAGIPAHISGGGGAFQEYLDGVGRHFLAVDVEPTGVTQVAVVEVP